MGQFHQSDNHPVVKEKTQDLSVTANTCEFNVEVKYEDEVELYKNVILNLRSLNFIKNKMAKSALLDVSVEIPVTEALCSTFEMFAGTDKDILVIGMDVGSNGTKDALSTTKFSALSITMLFWFPIFSNVWLSENSHGNQPK